MQQKELQIKEAEVQRKAAKDQKDAQVNEERLKLEGLKVGVDIAKAKDQAEREDKKEGLRMGIDIAKHRADKTHDLTKHREQLANQKQQKVKEK
jgi:hypothetical protein